MKLRNITANDEELSEEARNFTVKARKVTAKARHI